MEVNARIEHQSCLELRSTHVRTSVGGIHVRTFGPLSKKRDAGTEEKILREQAVHVSARGRSMSALLRHQVVHSFAVPMCAANERETMMNGSTVAVPICGQSSHRKTHVVFPEVLSHGFFSRALIMGCARITALRDHSSLICFILTNPCTWIDIAEHVCCSRLPSPPSP